MAFLALSGGRHDRADLATLFWGSRSEPQARQGLRQALVMLRRVLHGPVPGALVTNSGDIALAAQAVTVDALEARRALADGDAGRAAAVLISGPLLARLGVREPAFVEWLESERRRYDDLAVGALTQLVETALANGKAEFAVVEGRKLVALDPLNELSHRLLMRAYHQIGQEAEALRQYRRCVDSLRRELAVAPSAETSALAGQIGRGVERLPPAGSRQASDLQAVEARIRLGGPALPSVVVLPFDNLTGDVAQEHIADGLTEDVTAALAKISELFVIARYSAFAYKSRPVTPRQVADELGVRYVVKGSIQIAEGRIRVTGQLIDARSGRDIWSDRYDRALTDLFAVKDEITLGIVSSIGAKVGRGEWEAARRRETNNLESWLLVREGFAETTGATPEALARARSLFQQALNLDPGFAGAYVGLAACHRTAVVIGTSPDPAASLCSAQVLLDKALDLAPQHAWAQIGLAWIHLLQRKPGEALAAARRAAVLEPNDVVVLTAACWVMTCIGRPAEGLGHGRNALRLSPAFRPAYVPVWIARAFHLTGRRVEAEALCTEVLESDPNVLWGAMARAQLAVLCAQTGRPAEARDHMRQGVAILPWLSIAYMRQSLPFYDPAPVDAWTAIWRQLGMPRNGPGSEEDSA
jgi:TolB-like protein/Flp pilus assembly protein TadD